MHRTTMCTDDGATSLQCVIIDVIIVLSLLSSCQLLNVAVVMSPGHQVANVSSTKIFPVVADVSSYMYTVTFEQSDL